MYKKVKGDQYEAEQVVIAIFNGAGNSLLPRSSFGPHYFDLILEVGNKIFLQPLVSANVNL